MFRNLGKKPQKKPWGGTNVAHQVLLQLINPTFPWVWEYYWVTFSLMDKLFLNTLQDINKLLWMNQSKRTVLTSKSSEFAKSKQPPPQRGSQTNKNIPKSQCPCSALDLLCQCYSINPHPHIYNGQIPLSSNFQKASKIYRMLIFHQLIFSELEERIQQVIS